MMAMLRSDGVHGGHAHLDSGSASFKCHWSILDCFLPMVTILLHSDGSCASFKRHRSILACFLPMVAMLHLDGGRASIIRHRSILACFLTMAAMLHSDGGSAYFCCSTMRGTRAAWTKWRCKMVTWLTNGPIDSEVGMFKRWIAKDYTDLNIKTREYVNRLERRSLAVIFRRFLSLLMPWWWH
jgi:hypothetical protein